MDAHALRFRRLLDLFGLTLVGSCVALNVLEPTIASKPEPILNAECLRQVAKYQGQGISDLRGELPLHQLAVGARLLTRTRASMLRVPWPCARPYDTEVREYAANMSQVPAGTGI